MELIRFVALLSTVVGPAWLAAALCIAFLGTILNPMRKAMAIAEGNKIGWVVANIYGTITCACYVVILFCLELHGIRYILENF